MGEGGGGYEAEVVRDDDDDDALIFASQKFFRPTCLDFPVIFKNLQKTKSQQRRFLIYYWEYAGKHDMVSLDKKELSGEG